MKQSSLKIRTRFNFGVFDNLVNVFSNDELNLLDSLTKKYQKNIEFLKRESPSILKREYERLIIELSWMSSKIEGNTYSLLETETLIKESKQIAGHNIQEAFMILNHKDTVEYIREKPQDFKEILLSDIENIHRILTKELGISKTLRKIPVGIIGTDYRPLDNQYQIREAMEKTVNLVNKEKNVFIKTLILMLLTAYIQPFEDGNKRTSRLMGNAILTAYDHCPLSYRSVDEIKYKEALILFYEQNDFQNFKKIFIEQYQFAVENYFLT
jgi:Fic family protein